MGRALVICLLAAGIARAEETQRALLPLTVNGTDKGTPLAVLRGDDVLLRVYDLTAGGIGGFGGERELVDGDEFVSLSSLRPDAAFFLDPASVTLELSVPPGWMGTTRLDMSPSRPAGMVYSKDTSGFLNYAFNAHGSLGNDAFVEGGLSLKGDLVYTGVSRAADGTLARTLTSYTHDDREHLRRFVVGDSFAAAGGLGGALFLGGFSVSRNFDLDPYFVRTPTMSVSGAVTTPSTIDVYVNGSVVRRQQIQPGTFDVTSLGLPSGSGTAQVVVRDAFGNERTITNPFYASTELLAAGLSAYSLSVGLRRDEIAVDDGYGRPALLAWHRYGWNDRLTTQARLEGDENVQSAGESLSTRFPFGELTAEVAASRDHGLKGMAGSLVFRHLGRVVNYGLFARAQSDSYANLSLRAFQDRSILDLNAFAGASLGRRASLTAQFELARMRDAQHVQRLTLSSTIALSGRLNLLVSGGAARIDQASQGEAFVGLSFFVGRATTASVTQRRERDRDTTTVEIQKSLPLGTGLGYRAGLFTTDGQRGGGGAIQYQTSFGRYEARYDQVNDSGTPTVSISGGLVALGGTFAMTQPVGESFALIRVPGVAGVTGLSSNQPIARTNRRGEVIVPNLMPYYGNRLGIEDQDLPMDYEIQSTEKTVAPPYRGGAVVTFAAMKTRSIRGAVVLDLPGETAFPSYGELTVVVHGNRYSSPLGAAGEFELQNLPPGRHEGTVLSDGRTCTLTLDVPEGDALIVNLLPVLCVPKGHP